MSQAPPADRAAGSPITNARPAPTALLALLPELRVISPSGRRLVAGAFVAQWACVAVVAVYVTLSGGGSTAPKAMEDVALTGGFVLAALIWIARAMSASRFRLAWSLAAAAYVVQAACCTLTLFWLGRMSSGIPVPSNCDVMLLFAFYPLLCSFNFVLGRAHAHGPVTARAALDGIIAGTAAAAIGSAFLLPSTLATLSGDAAAVTTEIGFVAWDVVLLASIFAVMSLRDWRWSRVWAVLAVGTLLSVLVSTVHAVLVAHGAAGFEPAANLGYLIAVSVVAIGGWQPESAPVRRRVDHCTLLLPPTGFTLASLAILVYDKIARLPWAVFALAIITLVAACLRLALAFRDISTLADTRRAALTDYLTELPNRRMFLGHLADLLAQARVSGAGLRVLVLDLDDFKQLNDTLGHHAGDELLRVIGPRIRGALRPSDAIGRLGGDEFAILLHPVPDDDSFRRVITRILSCLERPFHVEGLDLRVTASIGVASYPDHAQTSEELLKCADIAMYLAKQSRSGWEIYSPDRDRNTRERLVLAGQLAAALENGAIEAHYQPIADSHSCRVIAAEALARWRRPDGSFLPPAHFLATAERAGLTRALTRRMLDLSLTQVRRWRTSGHDLHVCVNTCVADLRDLSFPAEVADALAAHHLPPAALVLEVTESSVLSDPVRVGEVLGRLRALGVRIALDDFGTGYSSLAHLRTLTVEHVKIDRSFVTGMRDQPADDAIVYATVELAHKLGLTVVAEGVEDELTWRALSSLGCDHVQGYVLGRPMPAADFERRLAGADLPRARSAGVAGQVAAG